MYLRAQNRRPSIILSQEMLQDRGFRGAHVPTISDPPLFKFLFFVACCDAEIF